MTASPRVELRLIEVPATPAEVYRAYSGYVAALAYKLLGRDSDVDDVVQDVFLGAVSGLGRLRDKAALKGWLAMATVRVVRRKLQRRRLAAFFGLGEEGAHDVASGAASAEQRALLSQVYALLDEVPPDERLAWTLRHIEGEPLDAVAQLCGCSLATAKRRISAVQELIERRFSDETE
jgi:RNA polymerase sigma-70 factor (ECF subfamily)